ncbi:MAG: hypothetical protein U5K51_06990 [Flavobacteriaceae bacterium]|nr:hypothetical protein [Flavobacteriaceae bacterium]
MTLVWTLFILAILVFLALDLGVFNRKSHVIEAKEAAIWTSIWVSIAMLFSLVIWWLFSEGLVNNPTNLSPDKAVLKYITGYLIELSLSIDNVFVIAVIFQYFPNTEASFNTVFYFGALIGAIVFRAIMHCFWGSSNK